MSEQMRLEQLCCDRNNGGAESAQCQSVSGAGFAHLTQIDLSESAHSLRRECKRERAIGESDSQKSSRRTRPQTALTGRQSKHALEDAHAKSKTQDTSIKHPPRTTTSTTTTTATTAQETTQTKYNYVHQGCKRMHFLGDTLLSQPLFQNTRRAPRG